MSNLESYSISTLKQCADLKLKIASHTPPKNANDEKMIRIYKRLLIRDRHYLHNLELLKIKQTMHLDSKPKSTTECSSSLDLDEFRSLLDENSELVFS
ncbi:MAG: hypothetical protein JAY99_14445 [Candidatus Thiodiazotropha lotti]|uniref:hypothetical protein n=1 Tax=Candidatus Thiodiazotropha endoloripes TaxID=1818881 RepID=UPI00083CB808|nr:hypothetical protein [Candidatus Thiodiazotropha endoloripes]MCG7904656.1 hypothetical protein [Candidatus Thiodiazotropha weberae]MCG7992940.1 hypothetical protein [Candidatus Thiodiazotropha lotti]MCG7915959.1 hypothetical protein [Candidatus Thiodiazotropha weberae]MCG8000717.1 hypothetical protein [Candidatus Thiodiazotropha lotti]MCW4184602.1 hypothetical protein [Candidatus Thiodiazotropha weberae]